MVLTRQRRLPFLHVLPTLVEDLLDIVGRSYDAALQAALSDGSSKELTYFAFDLLFVQGEDLRRLPLTNRKARLQQLLNQTAGPRN